MARSGFVVISWDPFGQGERGVSTRDHRRDEGLLVGIAQQGFAEYETQCALEYLLSLSEVDKQRIGITGASGGGYNSWITASLDDRIAAAVPVVGTSEFYEQICSTRPKDWYHAVDHCHFIPSLIRFANNHEFLSMLAPRPLLIIAAFGDEGFTVNGGREIYAYGQELYGSYGAPGKIGLFVDSFDAHGYQQRKREAAYGWFQRWLKGEGDGRPVPERPTQTLPFDSPELRCFPLGENQPAGPGMMRLVFDIAKRTHSQAPPDLETLLGRLPMAISPKPQLAKATVQRLEILSESWINVPGFVLRPGAPEKGVLIGVADKGKEFLASVPLIRKALAKGWVVCGVDFRGLGELATTKMEWASAVSLLLGESFTWRQGWDLRRAIDYLAAFEPFSTKPFAIYARGHNSVLATIYALAQPASPGLMRIQSIVLGDGFVSLRQLLDRPKSLELSYTLLAKEPDKPEGYDREIPFWYFVFNALSFFDLPQLLASVKARMLVVNPLDGDWNRMPEDEARKLLPWANVEVVSKEEPEDKIAEFLRLN
jgi:dienelactone hydrolase